MVRPHRDFQILTLPPSQSDTLPWEVPGSLDRVAFATLWSTGPSPAGQPISEALENERQELAGGLFRVQGLRRNPRDGSWETLDLLANPGEPAAGQRSAASARMAREFGIRGDALEGAPPWRAALRQLATFLEDRPVVVLGSAGFQGWLNCLETAESEAPELADARPELHDLAELAALLLPGRLSSAGEALPGLLLGSRVKQRSERALEVSDLRAATAVLAGRVLGGDPAMLAILAHALVDTVKTASPEDPETAAALSFFARILEHPSLWRGQRDELYPEHEALSGGQLTDALRAFDTLEDALEAARPRWCTADHGRRGTGKPVLSPVGDQPAALDSSDRRSLDEIFQVHLPRRFGTEGGPATPRQGQHELAARIGESFGERELLLLHAPTGTGKTLAYLVPTMLWAYRNGVRVGVATFTRALQEQAMNRDVPIALDVLAHVGVSGIDVSLLKGRQNYICWRALHNQLPPADATTQELLTWLTLTLFALGDPDGDLDRFTTRAPFACLAGRSWRKHSAELLRAVRARTGCCSLASDRHTCGAEAARERAERSHVVITNHAFALARREFFRYLVFDECEHLHDVAHNAFSHYVGLRTLRAHLNRFQEDGRGDRILNRVLGLAPTQSAVRSITQEAIGSRRESGWALDRVNDALVRFKDWRDGKRSARDAGDTHSLFREFAESDQSQELLEAHGDLLTALNELSSGLTLLAEHLDTLPVRDTRRLRRTLEIQRSELDEHLAGVDAWIPRRSEARPFFPPQSFHDLEASPAGEDLMATRVLLPHEFLGRHYYPDLSGVVFLSATTWLKDGFETSATYLGLTRASDPSPEEEREPCKLATHRVAEAFDYSRVLVAVPRDAPPIAADKAAYLSYAARFIGFLAERTRGRVLALFTNASDVLTVSRELDGFLAARQIPFWHQRMEGSSKEELAELFRGRTDSVLLGLDTFWYGTDFPGETLEYVVIVRLPYGVPDRYHKAQCAALGVSEQRRQIYMPRALAKFRQGFGRLMRRETDRGCVFVLDKRVADPRHRAFLRELPMQSELAAATSSEAGAGKGLELARLVTGSTDKCLDAALTHMNMKADVQRRGLERSFLDWRLTLQPTSVLAASSGEAFEGWAEGQRKKSASVTPALPVDIEPGDVPF